MISTCGNHPKAEAAARARQQRAQANGQPWETIYHGPRADCDYCHPLTPVRH